jgi:hypothetical protein
MITPTEQTPWLPFWGPLSINAYFEQKSLKKLTPNNIKNHFTLRPDFKLNASFIGLL